MSSHWISAIASIISAVGAAVAAVAAWRAAGVAENALGQSEESERERWEAENRRRRGDVIALAHQVVSESEWLEELSRRVEQAFETLAAFAGAYESGALKKRKAELAELRTEIASRRTGAIELVANPKSISGQPIEKVSETWSRLFSESSFLTAKKLALEDELEELRSQVHQFRDTRLRKSAPGGG